MKKEIFYKTLPELNIKYSTVMEEQFEIYKEKIKEVNKVLNLTAIDDDEGIYLKHFYDSLLIHESIPKNATVCDIGSGAGFPGIVLAIARPDIHITCIEPTTKRTQFLLDVVEACKLENVTVLNKRAEEAIIEYRESFDVATARAVAYLDILCELCIPFIKVDGLFIAMKGSKGQVELEESFKAIKLLGGEYESADHLEHDILGERYNLKIRKISPTPPKYPRNYGRIKKTPLSGRKNG